MVHAPFLCYERSININNMEILVHFFYRKPFSNKRDSLTGRLPFFIRSPFLIVVVGDSPWTIKINRLESQCEPHLVQSQKYAKTHIATLCDTGLYNNRFAPKLSTYAKIFGSTTGKVWAVNLSNLSTRVKCLASEIFIYLVDFKMRSRKLLCSPLLGHPMCEFRIDSTGSQ